MLRDVVGRGAQLISGLLHPLAYAITGVLRLDLLTSTHSDRSAALKELRHTWWSNQYLDRAPPAVSSEKKSDWLVGMYA